MGVSLLAGALLPVAITACGNNSGVIGQGITPDHLTISNTLEGPEQSFVNIFECFRSSLHATLFFSDGSFADYTNRVQWSSSDSGTVSVENHGDAVGGGPYLYANGTLTPNAGGNAIITATFFALTTTINVFVGTPTDIVIKRVVQGISTDIPVITPATDSAPAVTGFRMGVGTVEDLTVEATLNGTRQNIEATGIDWYFQQPNDGVATINSSNGHITGVTAGGPLLVKVSFDSCPNSRVTDLATTTISVADIAQIVEKPEFTDSNGLPVQLIVGNAEKINVFADFGQGGDAINGQDISTQTTLESSQPQSLTFGANVPNFANAVAAGGPVNITATFQAGGVKFIATDLQINTLVADLESINVTAVAAGTELLPQSLCASADYTIQPQPQAAVVIGSITPVQFCALGTYNGGSLTQDVTRLVTWTSSAPKEASIDSGTTKPQTAGQALAVAGANAGAVTIQATSSNLAVAPSQEYQLGVNQ